jgi:hypothetical protein
MSAFFAILSVGAGFPRPSWVLGGVTPPLHFLAAHDDTGKIIGGIIFAIIWAISAMASSAKKKQEQARQRRMLEDRPPLQPPLSAPTASQSSGSTMDEELRLRRLAAERHREQVRQQLERARAMAGAQRSAPPRPVAIPSQVAPQRPPAAPQLRRIIPKTRVAFVQPPVQPQQPVMPAPVTAPAPMQAPAARHAPSTSALLLHRWLNPRTLRSQYILTEIFQPPVGLREPRI